MSQAFVELYPESRTRLQPLPTGADLGAGLAAAVPFICAARGAFLAERLKKRLSLRKILAIEGRQCDLDGFGNVLPSNRCKKTLSSRIIPVIEGRRRSLRGSTAAASNDSTATEPPISWFLPTFPFFAVSREGSPG